MGRVSPATSIFAAREDLMTVFPFPHQLRVEAGIADRTLTIATTVRASGEVPIPIAFGYHPYFRLPGVERRVWAVEIPVSERVVLDSEKLPTGELEEADLPAGPLGSRTFDDEFAAPDRPFVLEGGGGGLRSPLARATPTHRSTRRTTT